MDLLVPARLLLLVAALSMPGCAASQAVLGSLSASYALATPERAARMIASYLNEDLDTLNQLMSDGGQIESATAVRSVLNAYRGDAIRDLRGDNAPVLARYKATLLVAHRLVVDYSIRTNTPIPEPLVLLWRRSEQAMSILDAAMASHDDDTLVDELLEVIGPWAELGDVLEGVIR